MHAASKRDITCRGMIGRIRISTVFCILGLAAMAPVQPADPEAALQREFEQTIRPFLSRYCMGCHGTSTPAAQFDMRTYSSMQSALDDFGHWRLMSERLSAGQMPRRASRNRLRNCVSRCLLGFKPSA